MSHQGFKRRWATRDPISFAGATTWTPVECSCELSKALVGQPDDRGWQSGEVEGVSSKQKQTWGALGAIQPNAERGHDCPLVW